ncbi:MAG: hypothetical protein Q8Q73_10115 [Stagnimonas sp.]|nr:hypothetical protein [Stagnimonas sp.]
MIVLSYGVTKSGSTLAFELCKAILETNGFPQRRLPDGVVFDGHRVNFFGNPSPAQLEAMHAALAPGERIAIKLHGPLSVESRAYLDRAIAEDSFRAHINYRDPREVCLSLIDAGATIRRREPQRTRGFGTIQNLEEAARFTIRQLEDLRSWAGLAAPLFLYYNDVAFETDTVIERLCGNLGLPELTPASREAIKDEVFNRAHTLKNKAVIDRHRSDLDEGGNRYLLETIPQLPEFIERACRQRDYRWLAAD